jgi:hypothetical protein
VGVLARHMTPVGGWRLAGSRTVIRPCLTDAPLGRGGRDDSRNTRAARAAGAARVRRHRGRGVGRVMGRRGAATGPTGGTKGLSRMWGNSRVRFLGEGTAATPFPLPDRGAGGHSPRCACPTAPSGRPARVTATHRYRSGARHQPQAHVEAFTVRLFNPPVRLMKGSSASTPRTACQGRDLRSAVR